MKSGRSIATILFTDIVASTEKAAALGDRRWRDVLRQHHAFVRGELRRFGGEEIATAGDGFLAVFESPERALLCAAAVCEAVEDMGLAVRCGVHMGEVERDEGTVGGIAVHIGARIAALAGAGEVLASGSVRDAEAGSGFEFEDRGRQALKGVPGEWQIYALTGVPELAEPALQEAQASGILERIRRTRLPLVLGVYLLAAAAILLATRFFVGVFGLPGWAVPGAAVLLLIGLAVIAATAWVQAKPETISRARSGELPGAREVDVRGLARTVARGRLPHLTWGRTLTGGVIAFALLFGLAGLYVVIKDRGQSFAPREAVAESAAPGLAILPFSVQGEGLESWREGMVDLLATNLDGVEGLRPIDSRTVLARWREAVPGGSGADLATMLDVGRRTGARYVLVGNAVAVGPAVRLTADVFDAEGGEKLGQGTVEGAPDSLFTLVDRLSIEVLRAIFGADAGPLPQVDLARATTGSLPALKAYLEGETFFRRSDFVAAIPFYERAVEADSTFALALYRLAITYGWAENIASELADRASERAVRFADRLPERDAILVRAIRTLYEGTLDGLEPLREAVRRFPDDVETWYQLGETNWHLGPQALVDPGEADRAFARAIELDPSFTPAYIHRIDWAVFQADSARAAELLAPYLRLSPEGQTPRRVRLQVALAFGDSLTRTRAWAEVDTMERGVTGIALNALWNPRFLDTQAELLRHVVETGRGGAPPGAALNLAINQASRGQPDALLRTVETPPYPPAARAILYAEKHRGLPIPDAAVQRGVTAAATDSTAYVAILIGGAFAAENGDEAGYAAAVARLRESSRRLLAQGDSVDARFVAGAARALEGHHAQVRGQRAEALRLLESALPEVTGYEGRGAANGMVRWWIGELLADLGRPEEAVPYFESMFPDPLAFRRLGELYEEVGDWKKAREAYEEFLIAWSDAEPEMAPEVERIRRRAAALEPLRRE